MAQQRHLLKQEQIRRLPENAGGPWLTILELFRWARSSQGFRAWEGFRCLDSNEVDVRVGILPISHFDLRVSLLYHVRGSSPVSTTRCSICRSTGTSANPNCSRIADTNELGSL